MKHQYSILVVILCVYFLLLFTLGQGLSSCTKPSGEFPYLHFGTPSVEVPASAGNVTELVVESNVLWKVSISPAGTDWISIDRSSGMGKDTIRITVLKDNSGNTTRTATISASSVGPSPQLQAQAVVTQSTYNPQFTWRKTLGGADGDRIADICQATGGDHVLVGYTQSNGTGMVRPTHGNYDVWVVRLNANGDTVWTRTFGGSSSDRATDIIGLNSGEFIIAGTTQSNNGDVWGHRGFGDCWVIKLKANGDTVWTRTYGTPMDEGSSYISAAPDGSLFVSTSHYFTVPGQGSDLMVLKLASDGQLVWQKTFGGTQNEFASDILTTADGEVVVTAQSGNHGIDAWVVHLDGNGFVTGHRYYGGTSADMVHSIIPARDGGFVLAGVTSSNNSGDVGETRGNSDVWIFKIKNNGDIEWSTTLGGTESDVANVIKALPNGGYIIAGTTASNNSFDIGPTNGVNDYLAARISSTGQKIWVRAMGGSNYDAATAIAVNNDNTFVIAGDTQSPVSGDINTVPFGNMDLWVAKMRGY